MSLLSLIKGHRGATGFGYASTAEQVTEGLDLSGKRILVTGVNSGLGYETARVLSMRGARILGAARTREKAADALRAMGADGLPVPCELSDPTSVRAAVALVEATGRPVDAIIANAGIMALPRLEQSHGYERQFFTNHIGHYILVTGLLDALADDGRVVMLSSAGHAMTYKGGIRFDDLSGEGQYRSVKAYGQSKLSNLLFARELAQRFEGTARTANAVHPGVIHTNLGRHIPSFVNALASTVGNAVALKSIPQGAATQCYVAVHPDAAQVSGEYWSSCNIERSSKHGRDLALAARLREASDEIVAGV